MNPVSTVGLDLAKHIFQLHGADSAGAVVFRKKLRRGQLLAFLATLPPCTVAMEACASAHYWGREIAKLGHTVRLISPAYVKPFVKRQKNDMADAEAICEAAQRPTMRFVALKSANQQAAAVVFRTRDLLVRQRTQAINALRGRDFAAWLGLTPVQRSSGGKERLGKTSKMGERSLRRLLIIGASAVARWAARKGVPAGSWLGRMLARKPPMLVRVALANKMARIVWALLAKGGVYRAPVVAAA